MKMSQLHYILLPLLRLALLHASRVRGQYTLARLSQAMLALHLPLEA